MSGNDKIIISKEELQKIGKMYGWLDKSAMAQPFSPQAKRELAEITYGYISQ